MIAWSREICINFHPRIPLYLIVVVLGFLKNLVRYWTTEISYAPVPALDVEQVTKKEMHFLECLCRKWRPGVD